MIASTLRNGPIAAIWSLEACGRGVQSGVALPPTFARLTLSEQLRIERHRGLSTPSRCSSHTPLSTETNSEGHIDECKQLQLGLRQTRRIVSTREQSVMCICSRKSGKRLNISSCYGASPSTITMKIVSDVSRSLVTRRYVSSNSGRGRLPKPTRESPTATAGSAASRTARLPQNAKPRMPSVASPHSSPKPRVKEETMLQSPTQLAKRNEAMSREKRESNLGEDKVIAKLNVDLRLVAAALDRFKRNIESELTQARWEGRADHRLVPHRIVDKRLDLIAENISNLLRILAKIFKSVLAKIGSRVLKAENRWRALYYARKTSPLESVLEELQEGWEEYDQLRLEYEAQSRYKNAYLIQQAVDYLQVHFKLKRPEGPHAAHRQKVEKARRSRLELTDCLTESSLKRLEVELIKSGRWSPVQQGTKITWQVAEASQEERPAYYRTINDETALILFKMHKIGVQLGCIPDQLNELGFMGHNLREIDYNRRTEPYLPVLSYTSRWTTAVVGAFSWSWRIALDDLARCRLGLMADSKHLFETRKASLRKFVDSTYVFLRQSRAIILDFEDLVKTGEIRPRNHPSEAIRCGQENLRIWMNKQAHARVALLGLVAKFIRDMKETDELLMTLERKRYRTDIRQKLEDWLREFGSGDEETSRRDFARARSEFLLWNGVRLLSQTGHVPASDPFSREVPTFSSPARAEPKLWLQRQSLYPESNPVIIDFVRSHHTLQQVLTELVDEQLVGIDICPNLPASGLFARYMTLATEKHVYILDCVALRRPNGFRMHHFLSSIFEDRSIVKVMMEPETLISRLWTETGIDAASVYDLGLHARPVNPSGKSISKLLEQHFVAGHVLSQPLTTTLGMMRQQNPRGFFYYMATRAYALLRLFYTCEKKINVRTTDGRLCDTSGARQALTVLRSSTIGEPELGPVSIDAASNAFTVRKLTAQHLHEVLTNFRKERMRKMSFTMASSFVTSHATDSSDLTQYAKKPTERNKVLDALSAYYLATVFCQTLSNIEAYLGLKHAARWILWAASASGLRLNPDDREKFSCATGIANFKAKTSFNLLNRAKTPSSMPVTGRKIRSNPKIRMTLNAPAQPRVRLVMMSPRQADTQDEPVTTLFKTFAEQPTGLSVSDSAAAPSTSKLELQAVRARRKTNAKRRTMKKNPLHTPVTNPSPKRTTTRVVKSAPESLPKPSSAGRRRPRNTK